MSKMPVLQAKADALAAQFNRLQRHLNDAPATVEKVVLLRMVRKLLEEIEAGVGPGIELERLAEVKAGLTGVEADLRARGLIEAYAGLSRAEHRRLNKLAEGAL